MKRFIITACFAASLFFIDGCAVNPVSGKKQLVLMSESQELAMGKEADPQIIQQMGLYDNKDLQDFINVKGKQMAAISHRPNLEYQFRIVDSDVLNAFAVPGGYVYFTRGIMAYFNNEAEFAGVLGHEIGHIAARHSVEQQTNAMLGQLGIITTMIISPKLGQFAEQASQGLGLLMLKFGRDAEREADKLGVEYSSKINYDAHQMADFFHTLERTSTAEGEAIPDFLSTHPNPGDRNIAVEKLATEWSQKLNLKNPSVNRDSYLRRIDGLVFGEDPRQGFVENNVFYHPVLKLQFPIPTNWAFQNSPDKVQMAPKDGRAMMMLTMAPGKTLQEATSAILQQYNLQALESKEITVNGLRAIAVVADQNPNQQGQQQQQQQQQVIRTLSYIIQYNDAIYHMIGVTSSTDFNNYLPLFTSTMQSFKELTDASKINRKPERVRIKTVKQSSTLQQAFLSYNVPQKRLEELAIVNGMKLTDRVTQGMLIKVVEQ
jgi:predicted Zn-dependent protease